MGLIGYLMLHLMAYMVVFVEYSALKFSSFPRFMSTYLMGMGFWTFTLFIQNVGSKPRINTVYFVGLSIVLLAFIPYKMIRSVECTP